jgi:lipopolysaccharide assembly protein A
MSAVIVILLILAILLVIFTLQNSFEISISFFLWEIPNVPLVLLILCCVLLGYIIGAVHFLPHIWETETRIQTGSKNG